MSPSRSSQGGTRTNTTAWVVQVILGILFLLHGLLYTVPAMNRSMDRMREARGLPRHIPLSFQHFIGAAEIAAAIGVTVPAGLRILTWLTPLAALGLTIVGLSATVFHLRRRETSMAPVPLVLGLLAAFVLYARLVSAPL